MTSTGGRDLGHGVRALADAGGGLVVISAELDLGWRPRDSDRPGSAVTWRESVFEVVAREPWRQGDRWTLAPWSSDHVMRLVLPLDRNAVAAVAAAATRDRRAAVLRPVMWLLLPVLGLAAASWQRRWRDEWGFPASPATWVSAGLEAVVGAACLIELIARMGAGGSVIPGLPGPLPFLGAVFLPEGLFRIAQISADGEPVGSVFGSAVAAFERRDPPPAASVAVPKVGAWSAESGELELISPIQRRDWEGPGTLSYRDQAFCFVALRRVGDAWVYRFSRVADDGAEVPRLRLLPPRSTDLRPVRQPPPSIVRVALLTAAVCLAARRFQERWAAMFGIRATWLTVLGGGAELVGGIGNLGGSAGGDATAVVLGCFFAIEGGLRFGSAVVLGRPMGSLLGLPLTPLLDRFITGFPRPPSSPVEK